MTFSFQQSVHKVTISVVGSKESKLQELEQSYLKGLLESIDGIMLRCEQSPFQLDLQFKVGRLPPQLQAGLQGGMVPLLRVDKKAVYIPNPEIFLANCLTEEYFTGEKGDCRM